MKHKFWGFVKIGSRSTDVDTQMWILGWIGVKITIRIISFEVEM
jgi:hypothetical protein